MTEPCGAWFDADDNSDHMHECVEHPAKFLQSHACTQCGRTWWHTRATPDSYGMNISH